MKVGIVGTRSRNEKDDKMKLEVALMLLRDEHKYEDIHIISGGCERGGDKFAEDIARQYQLDITIYHAKWNEYGNSAGAIRNQKIAKESDYLIACVSKDRTGGTEITIKEFLKNRLREKLLIV